MGTVETTALDKKTYAGIVNHHLLAGEFIGRFFLELSRHRTPSTFIIIAPNHESRGMHPAALSRANWKTPFGITEADAEIACRFETETGVRVDERAFFNEHSIGALVPFVKKIFPRARIVPIIIKPRLDRGDKDRIVSLLTRLLTRRNCFLVLSMDFSHGKTVRAAGVEDRKSIAAVTSLAADFRRLQLLDIDCPNGLEMVAATMVHLNARAVTILNHDHSGRMLGRPCLPGTSYVTVLFSR